MVRFNLIQITLFLLCRAHISTRQTSPPHIKYYFTLFPGGSGNDASAKLQAETTKDIQAMQGRFTKNAQKAVDVLLSKCCEVSLEVPSARIRSTQKLYGK